MKLFTSIKTASATIAILGSLGFASAVSAHNNDVENYLDAVVASHVTETKAEISNQTEQKVLTANYHFDLDADKSEDLVATVTVTYLTKEDIKSNGAE